MKTKTQGGAAAAGGGARGRRRQGGLHEAAGCGACHHACRRRVVGRRRARPRAALEGQDAGSIRTSIVEPEALIADGFGGGIMPTDVRHDLVHRTSWPRSSPTSTRWPSEQDDAAMTAALRAPGWYRAGLYTVARHRASRVGLTALIRALYGLDPVIDGDAIAIVAMLAAPLFFLVGLGGFDYWFYWAAGKPTRPEDHSGHGAHALEGLLPRQHRPQGDRDPVHGHLVLLPAGRRAAGDAHARRARRAGPAVRRREHASTACSRSTRRC